MSSNSIATPRLILRPFTMRDTPSLVELFNDPVVAATVPTMPRPYTELNAKAEIKRAVMEDGCYFARAITRSADGLLLGRATFLIVRTHDHAELSYAIGREFWGRGYATEAARAMLDYGFNSLGLHRIWAGHLIGNDASARILHKLGMKREGVARGVFKREGHYLDDVIYAILKPEFEDLS